LASHYVFSVVPIAPEEVTTNLPGVVDYSAFWVISGAWQYACSVMPAVSTPSLADVTSSAWEVASASGQHARDGLQQISSYLFPPREHWSDSQNNSEGGDGLFDPADGFHRVGENPQQDEELMKLLSELELDRELKEGEGDDAQDEEVKEGEGDGFVLV